MNVMLSVTIQPSFDECHYDECRGIFFILSLVVMAFSIMTRSYQKLAVCMKVVLSVITPVFWQATCHGTFTILPFIEMTFSILKLSFTLKAASLYDSCAGCCNAECQ